MTTSGPGHPLELFRATLRPLHDRIEKTVDLMRDDVDDARYDHFLRRSFAFVVSCEARLDMAGAPTALGLPGRLKRTTLELDLQARGIDPQTVPMAPAIPRVESWPSALGYLYVLEGSTLGSQLLYRHLQQKLRLTAVCTNFLRGYETRTGTQWRAFLDVLAPALAESSESHQLITNTAADTFTLLERSHALE